MKPHKQKRLLRCCMQQPFIQLFPFHVVDKHGLPLTQMAGLSEAYQLKTASDDLQKHHENLLQN